MRGTLMLSALITIAACGEDGGSTNSQEVITTVTLTFTKAGSTPVTAEFDDPDGDGGDPPTVQPVELSAGMYTMTVGFENRLSSPSESITPEVMDESDVHLVLFTGTAVVGPASPTTSGPLTQSYGDMDANGLPVGLTNTVVAAAGTGTLTVTLRHLPPEEPPVKATDTLSLAKEGGLDAIGGSTDATVDFMVTVR
ncbi:MAG: hypothetical protein JWP01_1803 [Myxococcales bacterium]|nr:hypothetical protein [Myxococcales bacterium]